MGSLLIERGRFDMTRDEWRAELEAAATTIPVTTTGPDGNLPHMTLGLACCVLERAEIIGFRDAVRELRQYARDQRDHTIKVEQENAFKARL